MKFFVYVLICLCLIGLIQSTLGPNDKKKKNKEKPVESSNKGDKSVKRESPESASNTIGSGDDSDVDDDIPVTNRNLVTKQISAKDILKYHKAYCKPCSTKKTFEKNVLGYVTPWNSKGYDISKTFTNKFDIISPVWLQIVRTGRKQYELKGTHDIDLAWMQSVRDGAKRPLEFLPRILFENLRVHDLHAMFNNEEELEELSKMLVAKCNEYKFDGYVMEIYNQLGGQGKPQISHLITDVANALHDNKKKLILVIPPPLKNLEQKDKGKNPLFDKQDFENVKDVVDGFSLMTYDYSTQNGFLGPLAPIKWVEANVVHLTESPEYRAKILLGLNFYGIQYTLDTDGKPVSEPDSIVGSQFLDILKNNKVEVRYDDRSGEHVYIYKVKKGTTFMFFPSLYTIQQRIELAEELGTGLSIWEIGQGLDYFYDLF